MRALLDELLREHREILAALDHVRHDGIGSHAGKVALFGARDALVSHLAKERVALYSVLEALARGRPHLRQLLADFANEDFRLGREVAAFFEHYTRDQSSGLACATELGRIVADLRLRIHREEKLLYPEVSVA